MPIHRRRPRLAARLLRDAFAALLVVAALPAPPAGAAAVARDVDFDAPTETWREGPVRYLLTMEEDGAYRRLAGEPERRRFIQAFWTKRDPDPSSPQNEYRALFYRRVAEASHLFTTESTKPGWKTDRGKIFILLGPPDDVDLTPLSEATPEIITWTYRDPPPGTGASPNSQVRFVRDSSGEYRLSSGVRLFSDESAMSVALAVQALQIKSLPEARGAARPGTEPAPAPGAGAGPEEHADLFSAGPGQALLLLTLWTGPAAAAGAATADPWARLAGGGPSVPSYDLAGPGAFRAWPEALAGKDDGGRVMQAEVLVRPGTFDVTWGTAPSAGKPSRPRTDAAERGERTLTVPDFRDDHLAVGPIGLASRVETAPEGAAAPGPPYVLGRLLVLPHTGSEYRTGESLCFYYQVLGAGADPIEGRPDLDLEYRIYSLAPGGAAGDGRPFGHPIHLTHEQAALQAFTLPLNEWASGAYRLEVAVTDNVTGATATGQVDFRVRAG